MKKLKNYLITKAGVELSDKLYKFIQKRKTKCPCFMCRAKMKYVDLVVKAVHFYRWLLFVRWPDIREIPPELKKKKAEAA